MKKGSATVFLVLLLSSLVLLLLAAIEVSAGYASGCEAEDLALVCGRSLLSEYHPGLWERYGLFALRADPQDLSELAQFYAEEGCRGTGRLVKIRPQEARADCRGWEAIRTEPFAEQIESLAALRFASDLVNGEGLFAAFSASQEASAHDFRSGAFAERLEELKSLGEAGNEEGEDPGRAEAAREARDLLHGYREATRDPAEEGGAPAAGGRSVEKSRALPSVLMGFGSRGSLLFSGGAPSAPAAALLQSRYILSVCGNALHGFEDTPLRSETEYILYGHPSDAENEKAAKRSLFSLRFALRTAEILKDGEKLSSYAQTAAALFPVLPAPVVVFFLIAIDAGTQAHRDIGAICSGETVPVLNAFPGFGTYEDYLCLFLLLLPEEERAARLMDTMQMNLSRQDPDFRFSRYAYGFELTIRFTRKTHVPDGFAEPFRGRTVVQTHVYR